MSVMFLSFEIRVGDKISRFFSDSAFCTSVCGLNGLVFYLCHILDHSLFILHRLLCMKYKLNIFPYKFPFHQLTHSCREKTKSNMYCICTTAFLIGLYSVLLFGTNTKVPKRQQISKVIRNTN